MKFKKDKNNRRVNYARRAANDLIRRMEENDLRLPDEVERDGIIYAIPVICFRSGKPEIKTYYFLDSKNRCDSYYLYDENGFREKVGFARGLREIAKDFKPILSTRNT